MRLTSARLMAGFVAAATVIVGLVGLAGGQEGDDEPVIPHNQSTAPGPALTPDEAQAKMAVPDGFEVELVAAEPDVLNPVAMTIDERGRIWIAESFEYPRHEPGPGRDRIRVLEDTTGDGKVDKVTTFAEGLNIPSGIAVGHGGVWVANSPDILFMQDTTGDGKADKVETVVSGFGRDDTHELPNSLTWGPDGWLYGLNGVFNYSNVEQGDEEFDFTAAIFRIHPVTREFQLFAQGTSNPWGIAFDTEGNMFISACVIDHLWHITESGYYVRQAGAYPPFTWRIDSIVEHNHQMAAYCGLVYMDSEAYPEEFRDTLMMGNIHGGAINMDVLERRGSTYLAQPRDDFLQANDTWFMTTSQKVGPDGLLYVLDWYDRYHCYQDALRDPDGVDRGHGRLWRVKHSTTDVPRGPFPDMGQLSNEELVEHLGSRNIYHRETAQRLLAERLIAEEARQPTRDRLEALVLGDETPHKHRMHALFALVSSFELDDDFHQALLEHEHDSVRAWGVRAAGNFADDVSPAAREKVLAMTADTAPDVKLQVAIASRKLQSEDAVQTLAEVLGTAGDDRLIPQIAWENLHPLLEDGAGPFMEAVAEFDLRESPALRAVMPRVTDRVLAADDVDEQVIASLVRILLEQELYEEAQRSLAALAERVRSGEVRDEALARVRSHVEPVLEPILRGDPEAPMFFHAAATAATWGHASAVAAMQQFAQDENADGDRRVAAVESLVTAGAENVLDLAEALLGAEQGVPGDVKRGVLLAMARVDSPRVGEAIVDGWPSYNAGTRLSAIETLTQRTSWSVALLDAIAEGEIDQQQLNLNQVRSLMATGDERIRERVEAAYGQVRAERNPDRERVIEEVASLARRIPGDPERGKEVFGRACASCHVIHGEGTELGPDLTANGRGSFEQLLSNIFDPNLVISDGYRLRTVTTKDGRVVAGMFSEQTDQRLVIQMIGGQEEIIAREDVQDVSTLPVSFMPEGLENAMSEQEMIDLLAFLSLSEAPGEPGATLIPGAPVVSEIDPERLHLPSSVKNLLVDAEYSSNIAGHSDDRVRGNISDIIWSPREGRFITDSEHREYGVGFDEPLGVVSEDAPVYWQAEWDQPVQANLIVLTGVYPNQPQPETAWKIEIRHDGLWTTHEQGVGGWFDSGRYVWGGAGMPPIEFDAIRISAFSKDAESPIASIHFRGEHNVSWVVANVEEGVSIER